MISQEAVVKIAKGFLEGCPMRDRKKEMKIMIEHDGKPSLLMAVLGYVKECEKKEAKEFDAKFFRKYYPPREL